VNRVRRRCLSTCSDEAAKGNSSKPSLHDDTSAISLPEAIQRCLSDSEGSASNPRKPPLTAG
jgi:hypothetical protein